MPKLSTLDRELMDAVWVLMEDQPTQPIRLWTSTHQNGWEAWVAQHWDGTFAGWACPATEDAVAIYIEDSYEHASAAALFDLRRLSDHDVCGPTCSGWQEREPPAHAHEDPDASGKQTTE